MLNPAIIIDDMCVSWDVRGLIYIVLTIFRTKHLLIAIMYHNHVLVKLVIRFRIMMAVILNRMPLK